MRTKVHQGGGKSPIWNESLAIPISDISVFSKSFILTLMEEDIKHDDYLGSFTLPVSLFYGLGHGLPKSSHHLFNLQG
jgi:Ca2+-dependent lipid-binding protein